MAVVILTTEVNLAIQLCYTALKTSQNPPQRYSIAGPLSYEAKWRQLEFVIPRRAYTLMTE